MQNANDLLTMQEIVNNLGDAVVAADISGKIVFYNPAAEEVLGVTAPDEKADKWSEYFGAYEQDKVTPFNTENLPLIRALKGEETDAIVQFIRNKNRPEGLFISVTGRPIRTKSNEISGGVVVIRDISKRMLIEEQILISNLQLVSVNKELEAFSYSVSHDLRAPLRSIIGFSDVLLKKFSDKLDSEGLDYLTRVKTSADKLGQLIDGLLDLSRLTRRPLKRELVNLSEITKDVLADLKAQSPERNVQITIAENIIVDGDPRLLLSVMSNLIGNAWKFTAKKPEARIELGVILSGENAPTYFVKDDGAGFNNKYSSKLFNIFQRLHGNAEFDGNGIGLATVKRIIDRHGGKIWTEGELNAGATFYFKLNPTRLQNE